METILSYEIRTEDRSAPKKIRPHVHLAHQQRSLGVGSEGSQRDLQAIVKPEICFQGDYLE